MRTLLRILLPPGTWNRDWETGQRLWGPFDPSNSFRHPVVVLRTFRFRFRFPCARFCSDSQPRQVRAPGQRCAARLLGNVLMSWKRELAMFCLALTLGSGLTPALSSSSDERYCMVWKRQLEIPSGPVQKPFEKNSHEGEKN